MRGWWATLDEQRRELQELFEDSPSLRGFAEAASAFAKGGQDAERKGIQSGSLGDVCPWTLDQEPSLDFFPEKRTPRESG
jgi:hypothetical protein